MPLYTHFCPCEETDDDFFTFHTVDAADPLPLSKVRDLGIINRILYTYDPPILLPCPGLNSRRNITAHRCALTGISCAHCHGCIL